MYEDKLLQVIQKYEDLLECNYDCGSVEVPHNSYDNTREAQLCHCLTMLPKMREFIAEGGRLDKVYRWLGFIQGVLFSQGVYCLEDLKNDNRMEELQFLNPVFTDGEQVTVRLGRKWYEKYHKDGVRNVKVKQTNGPDLFKAKIKKVHFTLLRHLNKDVLEKEHDQDCRTLHGLLKAMKTAYGDLVNEDSEVTVVYFEKAQP